MRSTRLSSLRAVAVVVHLIGLGVLVGRLGDARPVVVRTAAATALDTAAPDQLPGAVSVAPDDGAGSGRPSSVLPGTAPHT
jgi:hypothetical protein